MKAKFYISLSLIIFIGFSTVAETRQEFNWVDDADYRPLIYSAKDGTPAGLFYYIMTEAFRRMQIPLKIRTYPWARAQKIVKDGKGDGMITILTESRKENFLASDPLICVTEHIFFNKKNPRLKDIMSIHSINDVVKFRVVETIGSGWTSEKLKGARIYWVPDMESAFNMLIKGRADIYIANHFIADEFIYAKFKSSNSTEKYQNITSISTPLNTIAFRLLIHKKSKFANILKNFNKTLQLMKDDGTIDKFINTIKIKRSLNINKNESSSKTIMVKE